MGILSPSNWLTGVGKCFFQLGWIKSKTGAARAAVGVTDIAHPLVDGLLALLSLSPYPSPIRVKASGFY
jgi:hypothetical protein